MAHAWDRMSQGNCFQEKYKPSSSKVYSLQREESREACKEAGKTGGRVRSPLQKQSIEKLNSDREGRVSSGRRGGLSNTERQKESRKKSKIPEGMSQKGAAAKPKEARSRDGRSGAKTTNSVLYVCLVSRRVANPGNLTKIQNSKGVPTSKRRKLTDDELERYDGLGTFVED